MIGRLFFEFDQHSGGARLVDVLVAEAHRRWAVGVAVELAVQLLGPAVELLDLPAETELGDLVRAGAVHVGGEHPAVPSVAQGGVEHPAGLTREPLGGPGVAVVEIGDNRAEQRGRDRADRPQVVDGRERDDALADQLLGALGQLENLHPCAEVGSWSNRAPVPCRPQSGHGRASPGPP
jgi:hypothetical protein